MSESLLYATGLTKRYGDRSVVDGLDLACAAGQLLGLLGPNGAGKTTTLRMLYGFLEPDAGTIRVDGRSFAAHRTELKRLIGVCTQEDTLDYDFDVRQNLLVYARYFRPLVPDLEARVERLLDRFGLRPHATQGPRELSGGFRRRLMIARSIVHAPRLLFLDEPTTGLDPRARVDVWELVSSLRAEGLAIILTTHYMDEAERLSDALLVLSEGRAIASGTSQSVLGHLLGEHVLAIPGTDPSAAGVEAWARSELRREPWRVLGELRLPVSAQGLRDFSSRFAATAFTVHRPNLDDLFLSLSVEPAGDAP